MDALQRQAMADATDARRRAGIRRLQAAQGRVDDPDFGTCTQCGEDIAIARLRIDPALMRCTECTRAA